MKYLTLEFNGTEKSFADWGIDLGTAVCTLNNMAVDTYRFNIPNAVLGDTPLFPFLGKVTIRRLRESTTGLAGSFDGGYTAFVGWRMDPLHVARPDYQGNTYEFVNAWMFAETTLFQQPVASYVSGQQPDPVYEFPHVTDVALFTKLIVEPRTVVAISNGEQIQEALQFLLDSMNSGVMTAVHPEYANPFDFSVDTSNIAQFFPFYSVREISVAAVIQKCLELTPDAVVSWSYSSALPSVYVARRSTLSALTLSVADDEDSLSMRIAGKPSLTPETVIVFFRYTNTSEGRSWVSTVKQKYGPHGADNAADPERGPGVVVQTFDMRGSTSSKQSVMVKAEAFNANAGSGNYVAWGSGGSLRRAWWAKRDPQLVGRKVRFQMRALSGLSVVTSAKGLPACVFTYPDPNNLAVMKVRQPYSTYIQDWSCPNMIADENNAVPEWVLSQISTVPVTVETFEEAQQIIYNQDATGVGDPDAQTNGAVVNHAKNILSARVMMTDSAVGGITYTTEASTPAESYPLDLAQRIYESLSMPQYEGQDVRIHTTDNAQAGIGRQSLGLWDRPVYIHYALNLAGPDGTPLPGEGAAWATMHAQIQSITENDGTGEVSITFGPAKQLSAADMMSLFRFNRMRFYTESMITRQDAAAGSGSDIAF